MENEAVSSLERNGSGKFQRFLDSYFCLSARSTTVRRELLAGLTTFATMAYILVVNASILSKVGISYSVLISVTALSAAIMTAAMGLISNYPLAMAPGMGEPTHCTAKSSTANGMGTENGSTADTGRLKVVCSLAMSSPVFRPFAVRPVERILHETVRDCHPFPFAI